MRRRSRFAHPAPLTLCALLVAMTGSVGTAHADRWKFGAYGIYMVPSGTDARDFSRPGWGVGGHAEYVVPRTETLLSFGGGCEIVNLMSKSIERYDPDTLLRVEQNTSQDYARIYFGGDIGPHGHGFFRPYAGANVAVSIYRINTDIVVPNDADPENEIHQSLSSDSEASFGYDVTLGTDLNFDRFLIEGGVRFLKSFNVPQQLGPSDAVRVHPGYFQIFVGFGSTKW
jgi:hypothetical protein